MNWFIQLWRLTSIKIYGQHIGNPETQASCWCNSSPTLKVCEPGEQIVSFKSLKTIRLKAQEDPVLHLESKDRRKLMCQLKGR